MSAPFKDATNDAVQFLTKHGDLTRAAAYDAIRLLTGNGFVVTQTDMLPSATDLSQAAVAAALEAAAAICADHMAVALQDEKDPEALKGYARGMYFAARQQGIEIRAQITQPQHDALAAHGAAEVAKARADQARDAALVEAAGTLEVQALDAEAQAKLFRGGSDPWADRTARSRALRNSAAAILALRDKPAPGATVRAYLLRHRDTGKEEIIDAKKYNPTKLDFWVSPAAMASVEIIPLSAIAGGGDE